MQINPAYFARWLLTAVVAIGLAPAGVFAQDAYPAKAITIVVPYPAGGSNDTFARQVAKELGEQLAQPVVIDNRPGASGNTGTGQVAKAAPDGYTLVAVSSSMTTNAAIQSRLPFDPIHGFAPVAMFARGPFIVAVNNEFPASTPAELIAAIRAKPGQYNYASSGTGSVNQFGTELLKAQAKDLQIMHIPYKGMGPAVTDLVGNQTQLLISSGPSLLPMVRAGKLRAIGITSLEPSPIAPDLVPMATAVPGYQFELWWGLLAPAGTPPDIVGKLNTAVNQALRQTGAGRQFPQGRCARFAAVAGAVRERDRHRRGALEDRRPTAEHHRRLRGAMTIDTDRSGSSGLAQRTGPQGPLSGVRVLDLSAYIAGPYGCSLLADQGAEVIKIEPPDGDNLRMYPSTLAAESRAFIGVNRSKLGVALDLKQPDDHAALMQLVRTADVLVHNFRPNVPPRLGIAYDQLKAINPRLIYCSVTGYGETGPLKEKAGYDQVLQTLTGMCALQGKRGEPPEIIYGSVVGLLCRRADCGRCRVCAVRARKERSGSVRRGLAAALGACDAIGAYGLGRRRAAGCQPRHALRRHHRHPPDEGGLSLHLGQYAALLASPVRESRPARARDGRTLRHGAQARRAASRDRAEAAPGARCAQRSGMGGLVR